MLGFMHDWENEIFFILTELETINFFSLIVSHHDLPCMECCILIRGEKFILDII